MSGKSAARLVHPCHLPVKSASESGTVKCPKYTTNEKLRSSTKGKCQCELSGGLEMRRVGDVQRVAVRPLYVIKPFWFGRI